MYEGKYYIWLNPYHTSFLNRMSIKKNIYSLGLWMNVSASSTSSWYLLRSFVFPFYPVTYCYIGWRDVFAPIEFLLNEVLKFEVWSNFWSPWTCTFHFHYSSKLMYLVFIGQCFEFIEVFFIPFHSSSCKMVDGTHSLRKDQVRTGTSEN